MLPALEPWANSPGFQPHFTLALTNDSTYYHGSSNVLDANATSYTNTSVLLCQFPGQISILPGKPQYSVALAVPYTWLKVHNIAGKDTDDGFGDIEMFPIMLNWTKRGGEEGIYGYALEYQTEFGIFAPTGNFDNDLTANTGRNYWTFEPSGAVSYSLEPAATQPFSFQFTTSAGFDFNTKNGKTHYQTGDQFHLDGTLAAYLKLADYLPQLGGYAGVGVSGYFYQQITKDSGSGAVLGSFEGMTTGVGPVLSYAYTNFGNKNNDPVFSVGAEVKWLPELSVSNRLEGNIVWLKVVFTCCASPPSQKPVEATAARQLFAAPAATATPNLGFLYVLPSL